MPGEYKHYVHAYEEGRSFADGRGWAELYNGRHKMHRIVSPPTPTDRPLKYWRTFTIDTEERVYRVDNNLDSGPTTS